VIVLREMFGLVRAKLEELAKEPDDENADQPANDPNANAPGFPPGASSFHTACLPHTG
jgi:hypothetical protein